MPKKNPRMVPSILSAVLAAALLVGQVPYAQGATRTWSFDSPEDYTYTGSLIEITGGNAQLAETGSPAWYDAAWEYRKRITVDSTKIDESQTDFPLYIDLSSDGEILSHAQADGDDIRFTASDGVTPLAYVRRPGLRDRNNRAESGLSWPERNPAP